MANLSVRFPKYFRNIIYVLIGTIFVLIVFILSIILIPVLIYRYILTKWMAPIFQPNIAKALPAMGQGLATELLPGQINETKKHARGAIVLNVFIPGTLNLEQLIEAIQSGWLNVKPGETVLKYPEFQQYPILWKGYMFWKPDTEFSLFNHVHEHKISEDATKEECETIFCNLVESLVNKQFPPKRSPWEIHLLQNYKNPNITKSTYGSNLNEDQNITVVVFRFHHGMVDGFSVMNCVVDGLFGQKVFNVGVAQPRKKVKSVSLSDSLKMCLYVPFRLLWDAGKLVALGVKFGNADATPWTCPDEKKKWQMIYSRSEFIPVDKIKFIKNNLKVGFSTVLLACVSAAATNSFQKKGRPECKNSPFFCPIPLPNHPDKLRNHALGIIFKLCTNPQLSSLGRLRETEKSFHDARFNSQLPKLVLPVLKLIGSLPVSLCRHLVRNNVSPAGMTNFPGPSLEVNGFGRKCLAIDFCTGNMDGVCGIGFNLLSYGKQFRLTVVAENGILERTELDEVVSLFENELEVLYKLAKNVAEKKKMMVGKTNKSCIVNLEQNLQVL